MNYLLALRFNMLDTTLICACGIYLGQGKYMTALVLMVVGVIVVSLLQHFFGKHAKDKQWQSLADTNQKVAAIQRYRKLYQSSLKEALDAVDAYQAKRK